jgi:hypothetical protein
MGLRGPHLFLLEKWVHMGKTSGIRVGVGKRARVPGSIYKYLYYCNVCMSLCSMEGIISMTLKLC